MNGMNEQMGTAPWSDGDGGAPSQMQTQMQMQGEMPAQASGSSQGQVQSQGGGASPSQSQTQGLLREPLPTDSGEGPDPASLRWLRVLHETRYYYGAPVELAHHVAHLSPRDTPSQQVRDWESNRRRANIPKVESRMSSWVRVWETA